MTLEEAQRRIADRMTPAQKAEFERGCQIVDFYMALATDETLPADVRAGAREKLRAFALRDYGQTVSDVDGKPKH